MKLQKLESKEILENIFRVSAPRFTAVGMAFCRPQETYENPKFRGKTFSLDEFKDWYRKESVKRGGADRFHYCTVYRGWNIPNEILEPFYQGKFGELSDEEKRLLELFEKLRGKKAYIIGVSEGESLKTLKHELSHGLWYTDGSYKAKSRAILKTIPKAQISLLEKYLALWGYHSAVFKDEDHTYIMCESASVKEAGLDAKIIRPAKKDLNENYNITFAKKGGVI